MPLLLGIHGGVAGWTDRCVEVARELGAECYLSGYHAA
jgi:hypothetical protein